MSFCSSLARLDCARLIIVPSRRCSRFCRAFPGGGVWGAQGRGDAVLPAAGGAAGGAQSAAGAVGPPPRPPPAATCIPSHAPSPCQPAAAGLPPSLPPHAVHRCTPSAAPSSACCPHLHQPLATSFPFYSGSPPPALPTRPPSSRARPCSLPRPAPASSPPASSATDPPRRPGTGCASRPQSRRPPPGRTCGGARAGAGRGNE